MTEDGWTRKKEKGRQKKKNKYKKRREINKIQNNK